MDVHTSFHISNPCHLLSPVFGVFIAAKDAGFEIVDKSRSPLPDSEDVKKAIDAQGEDGQLLVNYFQVIKDDIPAVVPEINASTSGDKQPANGSETKEASTDGKFIVDSRYLCLSIS